MSNSFGSVEVKGTEEIVNALKELPQKIQKNVVYGAVRAATSVIAKEAKLQVPIKTGKLKESITVVKRRATKDNEAFYSVVPHRKKGGWYAHFVEFGTSHSSPKRFMTKAFEIAGPKGLDTMKKYLSIRVDKEIEKAKSR